MFSVPWSRVVMICEVWHWTGRAGNYTGAVSHAKTHTHCRFQMELVFLASPCVCVCVCSCTLNNLKAVIQHVRLCSLSAHISFRSWQWNRSLEAYHTHKHIHVHLAVYVRKYSRRLSLLCEANHNYYTALKIKQTALSIAFINCHKNCNKQWKIVC